MVNECGKCKMYKSEYMLNKQFALYDSVYIHVFSRIKVNK